MNNTSKFQAEDNVSLLNLFDILFVYKWLIFFVTLFSVVIPLMLIISSTKDIPRYKAVASFIKPNAIEYVDSSSIFESFLNNLISGRIQTEVFLNGSYVPQNIQSNKDIKEFAQEFINNIRLLKPKLIDKDIERGLFNNLSYSISVEAISKEDALNYLDDLVNAANLKTKNFRKKIIKNQIITLSEKRNQLIIDTKQERLYEIERIKEQDKEKINSLNAFIKVIRIQSERKRLDTLSRLKEDLIISKALGIKQNNFKILNENENISISITGETFFPNWYLKGSDAIKNEILLLESRESNDPFSPELAKLMHELNQFKTNNRLIKLKQRVDDAPFSPGIIELDSNIAMLTDALVKEVNFYDFEYFNPPAVEKINIKSNNVAILIICFTIGLLASILLSFLLSSINTRKDFRE